MRNHNQNELLHRVANQLHLEGAVILHRIAFPHESILRGAMIRAIRCFTGMSFAKAKALVERAAKLDLDDVCPLHLSWDLYKESFGRFPGDPPEASE